MRGRGRGQGRRRGKGRGREMTQTLYAHMNKRNFKNLFFFCVPSHPTSPALVFRLLKTNKSLPNLCLSSYFTSGLISIPFFSIFFIPNVLFDPCYSFPKLN
jgi:hypothetical protein